MKHYQNGEFHKDYDRAISLKSIVNFLKDPKGNCVADPDPLKFTLFWPWNSDPGTLKRNKSFLWFWYSTFKKYHGRRLQIQVCLKGRILLGFCKKKIRNTVKFFKLLYSCFGLNFLWAWHLQLKVPSVRGIHNHACSWYTSYSKCVYFYNVSFSGDLPWDEDAASKDVVHLANPAQFNKLLKTEKGKVSIILPHLRSDFYFLSFSK